MDIYYDFLTRRFNTLKVVINVDKLHAARYTITYEGKQGTLILFSNNKENRYQSALFYGIKTYDFLEKYNRGKVFEQYFDQTPQYVPLPCSSCGGSGKVDWVSKPLAIKTDIIKFVPESKMFVTLNDFSAYPNLINQFKLYVTKINRESGEEYCSFCLGTGIQLDGRFRIFHPFKKLRERLVMISGE
jgi:hypothetical protein